MTDKYVKKNIYWKTPFCFQNTELSSTIYNKRLYNNTTCM